MNTITPGRQSFGFDGQSARPTPTVCTPLGVPDITPPPFASTSRRLVGSLRRGGSVVPAPHPHSPFSPDPQLPPPPQLEERQDLFRRLSDRVALLVWFVIPLLIFVMVVQKVEQNGKVWCWLGVNRTWGTEETKTTMREKGMDVCDFRGDVREVELAIIGVLAEREAVVSMRASQTKAELEQRMQHHFYGPPGGGRTSLLRTPRSAFWMVFCEAIRSSQYITQTDGVPSISPTSLFTAESFRGYYTFPTYVALFSALLYAAAVWCVACVIAYWVAKQIILFPQKRQKKTQQLVQEVKQCAFAELTRKPEGCTFLELRRLVMDTMGRRGVKPSDIVSVWECPGDGTGPVEHLLRSDTEWLVVRRGDKEKRGAEVISLWKQNLRGCSASTQGILSPAVSVYAKFR